VDGSRRRLAIASLIVAVAGCDATLVISPVVSPAIRAEPSATIRPSLVPSASSFAAPTISASPNPSTSTPPAAVDLPAGFDAIAWADVPDATGDEDEFTVSIGVLGKAATTTRTFKRQPFVSASGSAVIISTSRTEIVDATTGTTIGRFAFDDLALPGVPDGDLNYQYLTRFRIDAAHGAMYLMSGNRDGLQIRLFDLDGKHARKLATIAPDPGTDWWDSDFVLTPAGTIVATACPSERSSVADHRCRLYELDPSASRAPKPRMLPRTFPRPCSLIASDGAHLIGSQLTSCRADGGAPQISPYFDLDLRALTVRVGYSATDLRGFGVASDHGGSYLVANLGSSYPIQSPYPAAGVRLTIDGDYTSVDPLEPSFNPSTGSGPFFGYVWAIKGWGKDWTLWHGFGPDYAVCAADPVNLQAGACPSGPVLLETPTHTFTLPSGTWGRSAPPLAYPAF
jgi:hypothetical protein